MKVGVIVLICKVLYKRVYLIVFKWSCTAGSIIVYLGDGSENFEGHRIFSMENMLIVVVIADLNDDNYRDGVIVFLNTNQCDNSSQILLFCLFVLN